MHIIMLAILFYIHTIIALTPYALSGFAVHIYYQNKEAKKSYNDAVNAYVMQFGGSREDAEQMVYKDPFIL